MSEDPKTDLAERIDAIERGYEFLLAYAAQGRSTDEGAQMSPSVRDFLNSMNVALEDLGGVARARAEAKSASLLETTSAFFDALEEDAKKAQGAIRLVLAQRAVSSQLIDNLNASIHLRALLTDLFVVDEALKA